MRTLLTVILALGFSISTWAQTALAFNKYWVQFKDKNNSPYSLSNPQSFLSERALARRTAYNIALTNQDLPVSPVYVQGIQNTGAIVLYSSKWLNGVVVQVSDSVQLQAIDGLPFVSEKKAVALSRRKNNQIKNLMSPNNTRISVVLQNEEKQRAWGGDVYYGTAFNQINMLNGDHLHALGYQGEGMLVAVLDAGFDNVDNNPAFETLRNEGRLLGGRDFTDGDSYVYEGSSHGSNVLSIMAAEIPGTFVGSAPKAQYYLIRTEYAASETLIEEYNWVAGAELADSLGVDVINSSLGYTTFDFEQMNHIYEDLDGDKTVCTRGADIAAAKGILVVISAGNSGEQPWHHISAPSDADSILTIGATDSLGIHAGFSGYGPSADGRVKPNIVGQGEMTAYVNTSGNTTAGNGTSYSSPLLAGLVTCLWQADRSKNNMEIIQAVERSASQYDNPDDAMGYGLPDFHVAMADLGVYIDKIESNPNRSFLYPNPFNTELNVYYYATANTNVSIQLLDTSGKILQAQQQYVTEGTPYRFLLDAWQNYPKGIYLVKIIDGDNQQLLQAIKMAD